MFPFASVVVEDLSGLFGFGFDAALECEFFPFGKLFDSRWWLSCFLVALYNTTVPNCPSQHSGKFPSSMPTYIEGNSWRKCSTSIHAELHAPVAHVVESWNDLLVVGGGWKLGFEEGPSRRCISCLTCALCILRKRA